MNRGSVLEDILAYVPNGLEIPPGYRQSLSGHFGHFQRCHVAHLACPVARVGAVHARIGEGQTPLRPS